MLQICIHETLYFTYVILICLSTSFLFVVGVLIHVSCLLGRVVIEIVKTFKVLVLVLQVLVNNGDLTKPQGHNPLLCCPTWVG